MKDNITVVATNTFTAGRFAWSLMVDMQRLPSYQKVLEADYGRLDARFPDGYCGFCSKQ